MLLTPEWRNRWLICGAILLAIVGAVQIASGSSILAALLCGTILAFILTRIQPVPLAPLVLGIVISGYIVGNRGFAQLSLAGSSPLLPAEVALLVGFGILLVSSTSRRELPFKRDPLNIVILIWITIGTLRLIFDLKPYGFIAVRDYAMVYYATFFYIAQYLAREEISRRFLLRCLYVSSICLLVVQPFYHYFPDFFLQKLTIRNIPLIFYKGDLLAIFLAVASLLYFLHYEIKKNLGSLLVCLLALGILLTTNIRAALLGLLVATGFLAIGRRWRFAALQICGGIAAVVLIVLVALAQNKSWESTPVFEFYERIISMADPMGKQTYKGEDTSYKGENNAFRFVWWESAIDETIETNPWTGLGFGYDLADQFVKKYYPTNDDDFTVRSPHNILVTIFARMGVVGLLPFLAIIALMVQGAIRAVKRPREEIEPASLWCSAWIVFTSACFGVVLEGPMGAVVFWTVLGLAHHSLTTTRATTVTQDDFPAEIDSAPKPALSA